MGTYNSLESPSVVLLKSPHGLSVGRLGALAYLIDDTAYSDVGYPLIGGECCDIVYQTDHVDLGIREFLYRG
jgi:hypothetical protein